MIIKVSHGPVEKFVNSNNKTKKKKQNLVISLFSSLPLSLTYKKNFFRITINYVYDNNVYIIIFL